LQIKQIVVYKKDSDWEKEVAKGEFHRIIKREQS